MKLSAASFLSIASLSLLASPAVGDVLSLTTANFDEKTKGKTVFLKMFAPWCGHCKAMASDWEKLAKDWEGHQVGLVAEVDCTAEASQSLCNDMGVEGFPTLLWGDPAAPETYEGGRDYASLSAFAKDRISKPVCSIGNIDVCDAEQKKVITELKSKKKEELEAMETKSTKDMKDVEEWFDKAVEEVNDLYEKKVSEYNEKLEKVKEGSNLKWVQQILNEMDPSRKTAAADDESDEEFTDDEDSDDSDEGEDEL